MADDVNVWHEGPCRDRNVVSSGNNSDSVASSLTLDSAEAIIVSRQIIEVGTLVVAGCAVTFGTTRRRLGGATAHPGPSSLYQM